MPKEATKHNIFLYVLLIGVIISITSSFYFFYFKKDFNFIIETKCNPETETCFYRNCTNPDNCPPNKFSYYNTYIVRARDFKACGMSEDCLNACTTGSIPCLKTKCTKSDTTEEICTTPSNININ